MVPSASPSPHLSPGPSGGQPKSTSRFSSCSRRLFDFGMGSFGNYIPSLPSDRRESAVRMVRGLTPTRNQTTKFGTTLLVVASLVFAIIIETTDAFLAPSSRVLSCYYYRGQSYLPPPSLVRMTSDDIPESSNNVNMESVWRFIKKPLLRLGSKGISPSHGNSLRELLKSHRVIKVKVNNRKDGTSVHAR